MHELISIKKKNKAQAGNELSNILPKILAREEKATTTTTTIVSVVTLFLSGHTYFDLSTT